MLSPVPNIPPRSTFLRPILSLRRPQKIPLTHSINANADVTMPVYMAVLLSSSPNDSTILNAYGKMDMKAMGSQIRQSAASLCEPTACQRLMHTFTHPESPSDALGKASCLRPWQRACRNEPWEG